jgi:hypothetical protein
MSKDRAHDNSRVSKHEESRSDYFERKFGYELANPKADTHEDEYNDANKRLTGENHG